MKSTLSVLAFLCLASLCYSQSYRLTLGNEIKLKKGTTDLDIIYADNTGLYFTESKIALKGYFVVAATYGTAQTLYKFDKNYNELFSREYKKEMKGLDFHSFQTLGADLFLFATDYIKKEKLFKVFGVKLDKNTGDPMGAFIELGSYALENKRDDYEMRLKPIRNSKNFLMVTNVSGKEHVSLGITVLSKTLKAEENSVIDIPLAEKEYNLEDVQFTVDNKIIVLGRHFEEAQVKKRKKRMVFKEFVMMTYDDKGKKENDISMNSGDRFIIGGQLVEQADGNMMLAGFYSNAAKKDDLSGFFINKIDPKSGQLTLASFKEIDASMIGKSFDDGKDDDDDESKREKKAAEKAKDTDDDDEFPNEFVIKSVDISPVDSSVIITSEVSAYRHYYYHTGSYGSGFGSNSGSTTDVDEFTNKDILVINASKDGAIKWMNAIPKSQVERIFNSRSDGASGISFGSGINNFFAKGGGMPYYSSFVSVLGSNNLYIILNDHLDNMANPKYGDKVKIVFNFMKRSNLYGISIDLVTGAMTRKFISANDKETILMPRHAFVYKNEVIIPSWRMKRVATSDLKFGRVTIK